MLRSIILALAIAGPSQAAEFVGRVVGVTDGDTVTVLAEGNVQRKIRLHGIDAPEKSQAFGNRAKQFTSDLCFGRTVRVNDLGEDRYRRTIGEVFLPDGRSLNLAVVEGGFAWWYEKYAADDTRFRDAESDARAAKLGLWADNAPMPPWEFRASHRLNYLLTAHSPRGAG